MIPVSKGTILFFDVLLGASAKTYPFSICSNMNILSHTTLLNVLLLVRSREENSNTADHDVLSVFPFPKPKMGKMMFQAPLVLRHASRVEMYSVCCAAV